MNLPFTTTPIARAIAMTAAVATVLIVGTVPASVGAQAAAESATVRAQSARMAQGAAAGVQAPRGAAAPVPAAAAAAAPGAAAAPDATPSCVGGIPAPQEIRMSVGKATLVNMAEPITRRTLGDPTIADGRMVSPTSLYLVSGRIGSTNAIVQGVSGRCVVLDIVVSIDTAAVQAKIAELMPEEKGIRVTAAADSIVLSGTVSDAIAADRAVSVANAYVTAAYQQGMSQSGAGTAALARLALTRAEAGGSPQLARIVNLLSVSASQQVMLEVKVAEISKTLIDKLGSGVSLSNTSGNFTYRLATDMLTATAGAVGSIVSANGNAIAIDADQRDGLVRILAEPTVMAISGQEGSFLAGGKILIPVAQNNTGTGVAITLEEKEFGVGLKFTPTVLSDGRINLKVAPEVSELSRDGVGISTRLGGTSVLPLITTRRAATTVQLFDGQSFAIGGLMKSSAAANVRAIPGLGEIPILGALFRSTDFQSDRSELVFVVTPRLVKPLPSAVSLPTDRVGEPRRGDIYLKGRLDSDPPSRAPSGPATGMELK